MSTINFLRRYAIVTPRTDTRSSVGARINENSTLNISKYRFAQRYGANISTKMVNCTVVKVIFELANVRAKQLLQCDWDMVIGTTKRLILIIFSVKHGVDIPYGVVGNADTGLSIVEP